jgi:hypothetical protein
MARSRCAAGSNRDQEPLNVLGIHANAVIHKCDGLLLRIGEDLNPAGQVGLIDTPDFNCVMGILNQFPNEDVRSRVIGGMESSSLSELREFHHLRVNCDNRRSKQSRKDRSQSK